MKNHKRLSIACSIFATSFILTGIASAEDRTIDSMASSMKGDERPASALQTMLSRLPELQRPLRVPANVPLGKVEPPIAVAGEVGDLPPKT